APLSDVACDLNFDDEAALVLRTAHVARPIERQWVVRRLCPFLQQGLGRLSRRAHCLGDRIAHRSLHERARGRETALDVARADDGFVEARRESGASAAAGLLLAASKARALGQAE